MKISARCYRILHVRYALMVSAILCSALINAFSQNDPGRTRIVAGIAGPELIHIGITHRLADVSQLGFSGGIGPSSGSMWSALSLEHRLYFGKHAQKSGLRQWFFRQGSTYFPQAESSEDFTLNLSFGKDFSFGNLRNGITIDAGAFYLPGSEESSVILVRKWNLWPLLRFQLYFSL